jgi:chitinase
VFPLVSQLGIKGIMGWSIGWDALNGWAFADAAEAADDMGLNLTHIL